MKTQTIRRKIDVDKLGQIAGTVCAVHCLLTGLALGLLSVVGLGFFGSETSEALFVGTAGVLGTWAVVHGVKKHHSWIPSSFFVGGLVSIVISHFVFGHAHSASLATATPTSIASTVFSVLGGLSLVTFHVLNQRFAHRCGCDCKANDAPTTSGPAMIQISPDTP
jgi:hypothetical protein